MYGDSIRRHRMARNMSQQELANALGLSAVAVSKWERGQTQPDIHSLSAMADLFGTTVDALIGYSAAAPQQEANIRVMTRAFRQLTPDEQKKFLDVGRVLFAHAFAEQGEDE